MLKACPNCKATTFYVEVEGQGMIFFELGENNEIIYRNIAQKVDEAEKFHKIYCVQCSWYGSIDELKF